MIGVWALNFEPLGAIPLAILAGIAVVALLVGRFARRRQSHIWQPIGTGLLLAVFLALAALLGDLLFWGLRQISPELGFSIEPAWPWPLALAAAILLPTFVLVTYPPRLRHLPPGVQRVLLGLRLAAAIVLVFALFRPAIQWSEADRRALVVPVLADGSRSMNTPDGPGGITRWQAQWKGLQELQPIFTQYAKDMHVQRFLYDRELSALPEEMPEQAKGDQTAIGAALESVVKQLESQRLSGVFLFGDFAQRAIPPNDADPRTVARRLGDHGIPVYVVVYGSPNVAQSSLDLSLEDLQISPTVFVKNRVVVGAKVRALGAAGRDLTVRLLVEQPKPRVPGQPPEMQLQGIPQKLRPTKNDETLPVELEFTPENAGEFRVALEVVPVDGELILTNNRLVTFLTVLRGGLNVAYFDRIRPEQKFVRRMTESPDIQLDFKAYRSGSARPLELEPDWFQPGRYDVYIIGDIPASAFESQGGQNPLEQLRRAVERGSGVLMTGGVKSFGAGGWGSTPLAALLPVILDPRDLRSGPEPDLAQNIPGPLPLVPTTAGLQHFVMRLDAPAKNLARWQSLGPLAGANKFGKLKPLAQVLAESPQKAPLLVAEDIGQGRSMAFAGDTTFQWVLEGKQDAFQQFWRQMILWLAHKELQGDSSVWLKLPERRFRPGQGVEITCGARTPDGLPLEDAELKVEVTGPKGEKQQVPSQRQGKEHFAKFVETRTPGEYLISVIGTKGDKTIGSTQARFIVYEQDLELHNPAADPGLAEEIASASGGSSVPPEQLGSFLKRLLSSRTQQEDKRVTIRTLWDNWLMILLFAGIICTEWFYRKFRGLV